MTQSKSPYSKDVLAASTALAKSLKDRSAFFYNNHCKGKDSIDGAALDSELVGKDDYAALVFFSDLLEEACNADMPKALAPENAAQQLVNRLLIISTGNIVRRFKQSGDSARDAFSFIWNEINLNLAQPILNQKNEPDGIRLQKLLSKKKLHPRIAARGAIDAFRNLSKSLLPDDQEELSPTNEA